MLKRREGIYMVCTSRGLRFEFSSGFLFLYWGGRGRLCVKKSTFLDMVMCRCIMNCMCSELTLQCCSPVYRELSIYSLSAHLLPLPVVISQPQAAHGTVTMYTVKLKIHVIQAQETREPLKAVDRYPIPVILAPPTYVRSSVPHRRQAYIEPHEYSLCPLKKSDKSHPTHPQHADTTRQDQTHSRTKGLPARRSNML